MNLIERIGAAVAGLFGPGRPVVERPRRRFAIAIDGGPAFPVSNVIGLDSPGGKLCVTYPARGATDPFGEWLRRMRAELGRKATVEVAVFDSTARRTLGRFTYVEVWPSQARRGLVLLHTGGRKR